jgi:hypothetical protein
MNIFDIWDPKGSLYCPFTGKEIFGDDVEDWAGGLFFIYPDMGIVQVRKEFEARTLDAIERIKAAPDFDEDSTDLLEELMESEFSKRGENFVFYKVTGGNGPHSFCVIYGFAPGFEDCSEEDFVDVELD